jgi:hypothetical protein
MKRMSWMMLQMAMRSRLMMRPVDMELEGQGETRSLTGIGIGMRQAAYRGRIAHLLPVVGGQV